MRLSAFLSCVFLQILIFTLIQKQTLAIEKSYVVLLGAHPHDVDPKMVDVDKVKNSHHDLLRSFLGSKTKAKRKIYYSYAMHMNAFAAVLEEDEAANLRKHPGVISVSESTEHTMHTTHAWEFLGMEKNGEIPLDSIWTKASMGKDVIIGNLDSGIWPQSKSFNDEGLTGPIPAKWRGICQFDPKSGSKCNSKLIGARYFNKEYALKCEQSLQMNRSIQGSTDTPLNCHDNTPLDTNGHGTHTLSIAGGSFVPNTSLFGHGQGTAKGAAPMARVAAYRVCGDASGDGIYVITANETVRIGPCCELDILAGYEAAIADGVDVINMSLGGGALEFYLDFKSIAAFHAVKRGIVVVTAASNLGPDPATVDNVAPWLITVGSTSTDREFVNYLVLASSNMTRLMGTNMSDKKMEEKPYPLITGLAAKALNASDADAMKCKRGSLDLQKLRDKILVCRTNITLLGAARISEMVVNGSGIGFITVNDEPKRKITNTAPITYVPSTNLGYEDGQILFAYIDSTPDPMGYITPITTEFGTKPAPVVSFTSSRGPSTIEPSILKPDITGPGVNIMAGYPDYMSPNGRQATSDPRRVPFSIMSGTSMASPAIAGIAALLKSIHPDWSPAAIKSAMMTTSSTEHNRVAMLDSTMLKATPFDYGAGRVEPNLAMDPGLVYDLSNDDYLNFLCGHGYNNTALQLFSDKPYTCPAGFNLADFNYPSITVPNLVGDSMKVTRRLKNVGSSGVYQAHVNSPPELEVTVDPPSLAFEKIGEEKMFTLTIKPTANSKPNNYVFGELVWSDGVHFVKSPLVVKTGP